MTTLLPTEETIHLIRRYAALYQRLGHEIGTRPLVLPDGKFFPDTFTADEKSVRKLARRMKSHAGMNDIPVRVRVTGLDGSGAAPASSGCCGGSCHSKPAQASEAPDKSHQCSHEGKAPEGSCGSGACGNCAPEAAEERQEPRLVDLGEEWLVQVPAAELRSDIVLTTNLAKVLALIFLFENMPKGTAVEEPVEVSIEIASVALGFGALLLEGSYLYSKSCGGPKVGRVTTLDCSSVALLTALFVARGRHQSNSLRRHLSTTQLAAFREAESLVLANRSVVEKLSSAPEKLLVGEIPIRTSIGVWDRLFGGRPARKSQSTPSGDFDIDELEAMIATQRAPQTSRQSRRVDAKHAELRALVDDALAESAEEV